MLEATEQRLTARSIQDDLIWPIVKAVDEPLPHIQKTPLDSFWSGVRDRHRHEAVEVPLTDPSLSTILPSKWTTISIHLASEQDSLVLVRHRRDTETIVFRLPLDRYARREGEDESFTYDAASSELQDIIVLSNAGAQRAKDVDGKEMRTGWWKERRELDARLGVLLEMMENNWLGAFKVALS
jgi:separase